MALFAARGYQPLALRQVELCKTLKHYSVSLFGG